MTPFAYSKPRQIEEALRLAGPDSLFIAGGTAGVWMSTAVDGAIVECLVEANPDQDDKVG